MSQETTAADEATLKPNTLTFADSLAIGLNATSPAYSIAAIIGPLVVIAGVATPGVLLVSFVPMLLIASAFLYLNRVDPDCGTVFSWVSRAMGPWWGWIGGWAITMTGVLVVGSLAEVGVRFTLLMVRLDDLAANSLVVLALSVGLIVLMTWICVTGTEISSHLQNVLILAQVVGLLIFAGTALWLAYHGDALPGAPQPSLSWFNPFASGGGTLSAGLLLGVFAYWGWESAVNLNEETTDSTDTPGRAAVVSTVLLLVTYLGTAVAVIAYAGPAFLNRTAGQEEEVFATLATKAMGPWAWVVMFAVATSAVASTQTTIIPASRTALSMARRAALPRAFARISPRHRTPAFATWWVAIIAIIWFVVLSLISENALYDSLTALSLLIAFYYALTGLACAIYFRRVLLTSARHFLFIGVGPVVGAVMLIWLLWLSAVQMSDPANSYEGVSWFGMGPPLVIGIGIALVGVILMVASRVAGMAFWQEHAGVVTEEMFEATG